MNPTRLFEKNNIVEKTTSSLTINTSYDDSEIGHLEYIEKKSQQSRSEFDEVMKGSGMFKDFDKIKKLRENISKEK